MPDPKLIKRTTEKIVEEFEPRPEVFDGGDFGDEPFVPADIGGDLDTPFDAEED